MKPLFPSLFWFFESRHPAAVERDLPRGVKVFNSALNAAVWLIVTWTVAAWFYNTFLG